MDMQELKNHLIKGDYTRRDLLDLLQYDKITIIDIIDLLKDFAKTISNIQDLLK